MRRRQKPSFVHARRQIHAGGEHGVEKRSVRAGGLLPRGGIIRHSGHAFAHEENAEQVPRILNDIRHSGRIQCSRHLGSQPRGGAVNLLIDLQGCES
jgi:hypothetical protein